MTPTSTVYFLIHSSKYCPNLTLYLTTTFPFLNIEIIIFSKPVIMIIFFRDIIFPYVRLFISISSIINILRKSRLYAIYNNFCFSTIFLYFVINHLQIRRQICKSLNSVMLKIKSLQFKVVAAFSLSIHFYKKCFNVSKQIKLF